MYPEGFPQTLIPQNPNVQAKNNSKNIQKIVKFHQG